MAGNAKIALILVILVLPPGGLFLYGWLSNAADETRTKTRSYETVDWRKLSELDFRTGKRSETIDKLNGKRVKVPGFVVPLDDDSGVGSEFLLVPSPQACIHVPPPPPNQMVMVTMIKGEAPQRSHGPVWVKGKLIVGQTQSPYGKVAYKLMAEASEAYKVEY